MYGVHFPLFAVKAGYISICYKCTKKHLLQASWSYYSNNYILPSASQETLLTFYAFNLHWPANVLKINKTDSKVENQENFGIDIKFIQKMIQRHNLYITRFCVIARNRLLKMHRFRVWRHSQRYLAPKTV